MTPSRETQDKTLTAPASAAACPIAPGDVLSGRYTVELLLGEGTFGWVFSAIDSIAAPSRRVAIKVLRPERAKIPEALRRFQDRELALLHRLEQAGPVRHVVRVLEPLLGMHRDLPFIVLELIDGPSLRDRINDGRPFTEVEAARIGHGIACGLVALHAAGIVHRDLKPANIRLRGGTEPVIVDLGIATAPAVTVEFTETGKAPMTARYAAPEQLAGRSAGAPCDVYAFGVILEEMAAGRRLDWIARHCLEREQLRRPSATRIVAGIGSLLPPGPGERRPSVIFRALRFLTL
jgi:serine/threonine-protein kinase